MTTHELFPVRVSPGQLRMIAECICGHFGMDEIVFSVICSGGTGVLQIDLAVEFAGRIHDCCVLIPNQTAKPVMLEGFHAKNIVRHVLYGENHFAASSGSRPVSIARPAYGT